MVLHVILVIEIDSVKWANGIDIVDDYSDGMAVPWSHFY